VRWNERVLGSISIRSPFSCDFRKMLLCHVIKCKSLGIRTKGLVFDCCPDAVSTGVLQNCLQNLTRPHFAEIVANQPVLERRSYQDMTRSAHITFSLIPRSCCQHLMPPLHPLQSIQGPVGKGAIIANHKFHETWTGMVHNRRHD
jgi:hypothetical protein